MMGATPLAWYAPTTLLPDRPRAFCSWIASSKLVSRSLSFFTGPSFQVRGGIRHHSTDEVRQRGPCVVLDVEPLSMPSLVRLTEMHLDVPR